ncbi:hypothetical protein KR222_002145 [Zaprionus bogoriensis]|nr:hypothetical protein KR222_002145 [Zaprionus bogoriensis]
MFPLLNHTIVVVCRCCLAEQPPLCQSIGDNRQLSEELLALAPNLQVTSTDVVCLPCQQRLHDALDFRQRCEDSERILRARHEQALDDALECLEREVGSLEQAKAMPVLEPVDFGTLDLSDSFPASNTYVQLDATQTVAWDSGVLNTPVHLPASIEQLDPQISQGVEQLPEQPNRKRAARKAPTEATTRSRTPKSLRPCSECEKKFTRNFQLKLHMISVHGLGDGLRYQCEVCSKSFASRHSLRYHTTSLHSTERPFACDACDRRFVLRTQLISHARMHTGEAKPRIFSCSVCAKTWPTKSDLRTHMRSHDPDMSKRPFKCDKCDKAFFTRGHLSSHHLVHTGEKPFACAHCDKSYQSVGNLNNHMVRQHAGILEEQLKYPRCSDIES